MSRERPPAEDGGRAPRKRVAGRVRPLECCLDVSTESGLADIPWTIEASRL
ncbi:MAG TPA: hypothetical protein VGW12_13100 [Pyrinomonadaceae bacterium]|nr:hypothetical protein [Pyrinomonadaceae bacterium]